jgi:predicted DNA-binding helix-hairpin-helix protein
MWDRIREKFPILTDAAEYDVSCSPGGSKRQNPNKTLGNSTGMGICHSYMEDGRCVPLLKNYCIYYWGYCVSRKSNDVKRVASAVQEVVSLIVKFYRRNFNEGLFVVCDSNEVFYQWMEERILRAKVLTGSKYWKKFASQTLLFA